MHNSFFGNLTISVRYLLLLFLVGCSTFRYKTYDEKEVKNNEDPEPDYNITLDQDFQDFTTFMFLGNRIENFSTYFNTYYNATENFDKAYEDYSNRVLLKYNERLEYILERPTLPQEAIDNFNKAIEKASKVIQYHKSSDFMDKSVLLVGKCYFYLGDYLKAERKFGEFISRLSASKYIDEALLYLSRTQLRLDKTEQALSRLEMLTKNSKDRQVVSESYQSIAEYYLSRKDYERAVKNFKKAIEFSNDKEFKAQMQYLTASVIAKTDPLKASLEFEKVLDYRTSYELEYLAKLNMARNLILCGKFGASYNLLEDLSVKYKDNTEYLGQIDFLKGFRFEKKNETGNFLKYYSMVMKTYPGTAVAADASYRTGLYYESQGSYLDAFRYYKYSTEQNTNGQFSTEAFKKKNIFQKYFELHSVLTGEKINTDYDVKFKRNTSKDSDKRQEIENEIKGNEGEGKPGGLANSNDSVRIENEKKAKAKFELAELFLYEIGNSDSAEYYLKEAYSSSEDYDFRAKVLFAMAAFYRSSNDQMKSDEILTQIISEYPLSDIAVSSKKLLNIPVEEENYVSDPSDSLFFIAEKSFINKDYENALIGFSKIISAYPYSRKLDKAFYAAGWIYENVFMKPDSAFRYYSSILELSPNSEYAMAVADKISAYNSYYSPDTNISVPDTGRINPEQLLKELEVSPEEKPELIPEDGSVPNIPDIIKEDEKEIKKNPKK
ncbi:MAG: hypothetical protein N2510_01560 [Ignavibacteria bacterium]|nr:hypothetical protein [Ignavibacteria bacterium]